MCERLVRGIFTPPDDPMRSRLARRYSNEISIFLGENNVIYVNHVALLGSKDPAIGINMCWQAMQLLAMRSNTTLRLPQQAAGPAEVLTTGQMVVPEEPTSPLNGTPIPTVALAHIGPENGHH